jgi:predicted glycoside hydrolase/deacetylase ChbG (UPF0249 family)
LRQPGSDENKIDIYNAICYIVRHENIDTHNTPETESRKNAGKRRTPVRQDTMKINKSIALILALCACSNCQIRLVVRSDDMGFCHAANAGIIQAFTDGIETTAELMAVCPGFDEAVQLLRAHPGLDAGVHLVLTSEWDNYKWGPLTNAPSLVDTQGHFYPLVQTLVNANPATAQIENELRAQIKRCVDNLPNVTHLSYHMNAAQTWPAIVNKLSAEFNLPTGITSDWNEAWSIAPDQKVIFVQNTLQNISSGVHLLLMHCAISDSLMQTLNIAGSTSDPDHRVALHRSMELAALTNATVKTIVQTRSIQLKRYCDILNNCKTTQAMMERTEHKARMNVPHHFTVGDVIVAYDAFGRSVPAPDRLFTHRQGPDHSAQSIVIFRIYRDGKLVSTGKTPGL